MMEEQYKIPESSPWMMDTPGEKRFALAGFMPNERVGQQEMDEIRADLVSKIRDLGGTIVDGDSWNNETTHVVVYNDPHKEGLTEKVILILDPCDF